MKRSTARVLAATGITAAALAVMTPAAQARVPTSDTSDRGYLCLFYQQNWDSAYSDYVHAGSAQASSAALQAMADALDGWNSKGCADLYGHISFRIAQEQLLGGDRAVTSGGNQAPVRPSDRAGGVTAATATP